MNQPQILVVGAGGIGGIVTAALSEVGAKVVVSTTNEAIFRKLQNDGFSISGDGSPRTVPGRATLGIPADEKFQYILLATQPPQVEQAARDALKHLADDGRMVVFQNGLCEQRIARICGPDRVIGAIIAWGASMPEPGVYDRTSSGGFQVGTISGLIDGHLRELGTLLEAIGPVRYTTNLLGARWSKLALNCCISSLGTIGGERLGQLVQVRRYRRLGLEVFAEVVRVARAEGVRLEKVSGTLDLNWIAITDKERTKPGSATLAAKHAALFAVGMRYRRLRSSMLSALERGRPPSVDFLNGEVVEAGTRHNVPTPLNARIVQTIHQIAQGQAKSSRDTLDELYAATR